MHSRKTPLRARWAALFAAGFGLAAGAQAEGRFAGPVQGAALASGSMIEVVWTEPCPGRSGESETELVLSLDGGLTFPVRVSSEMAVCAKSFRWQVPALASAHARLALRAGSGEGSASERLDIVSEEFSIVVGEADDSEDLVQGSREWWTPQALAGAGAEDIPSESMAGGGTERLVAPDFWPDMTDPDPPGCCLPEVSAAKLEKVAIRSPSISPRPLAERGVRLVPLRL